MSKAISVRRVKFPLVFPTNRNQPDPLLSAPVSDSYSVLSLLVMMATVSAVGVPCSVAVGVAAPGADAVAVGVAAGVRVGVGVAVGVAVAVAVGWGAVVAVGVGDGVGVSAGVLPSGWLVAVGAIVVAVGVAPGANVGVGLPLAQAVSANAKTAADVSGARRNDSFIGAPCRARPAGSRR
jgi:hypothetical protein